MSWTTEQQKRLNKEWELVRKYFPAFQLKFVDLRIHLEGWMKTNFKNQYYLRVYVPRDFPNSVPEVIIMFPEHLIDYSGKKLTDYHQNPAMHLLPPRDGCPTICTYKPTHWNPSITIYNVLVKSRIWLEAFDGHRITGKPMDYYLTHQN